VAAELMAGTDGDSLLFLYDLGSGTGNEAPQPWPMPRGNLARTGSRIGPGAISPLDTVPPSPVADLAATVSGLGIDLTWTAPADVGTPPHASSYEMRWALVPLDEASFESGSPVTVLQAPGGAGQPEHLRLTGFAEARTYYFALKSRDPGWNLSPISNLATVAIPAIPPARIGDLRAVVVRDSSVMLQWTASGDDSLVGRPRRYNVRGAPQPLDPAGFPTAPIQADAFPTGEGSGWSEHLVLTGLPIGQPLWFAIEAEDDLGLKAPISNLAAVPAPVLRPARVGDLSVFAVIDGGIELDWTAVGDDSLLGSAARYLLRATPTPLDSAGFDTAPLTREIPPLSPGETVRYLLTGLAVGQPLSFGVKAEDDLGLRSALSNVVGLTFRGVPPARVTDLRVETAVDSGVVLRWPESGDDGTLGRASRYLLAADTTALDDSTFDAARFRLEVERGARGVQRTTFRHLPTGHTMFFAVEAVDDIGSRSPISNLATALIDRIRPARVTDLTVLSYTDSSLTLSWTATGDDSLIGRPARYHLRASPDPIDETTFDQAPFAVVAPAGVDPGLAERATLQHLPAREPLYLALEVEGNDGLRSALSNLVSTAIEPRPPQAVADLATEGASENGVSFRWTASGDDGTVGQAQDYLLHGAPEPITADNFAAAPIAVTIPAARPSGSLEHGRFDQVTVGQQLWFAIKARDRAGALSALSNIVPVTVVAQAPAAVSDLRVDGSTDSSVTLSWTATGDDGSVGRPAFYELRASLAPIDEAGFDSAEPVQRTPATVDAGGIEHFRFPDLAPGRYWWIALRAVDVAHNGSALSNQVTGRTGIGGPLSGRTGAALAALQQPSRSPVILYWQSDAGAEQATHTIELFDLNGRCVRRLSAGPGVGGVVPWDARNENGERLPAGLYFARIVDAASRTRARIVLLP
jgi:hypothetical protein